MIKTDWKVEAFKFLRINTRLMGAKTAGHLPDAVKLPAQGHPGFEYIEPYGDGSQTIYYYAPLIEVSMPIPAWVERRLSKSCLNEYMEGVRKKAEKTD